MQIAHHHLLSKDTASYSFRRRKKKPSSRTLKGKSKITAM
jgi:hypothetical protein